MNQRKPLVLPGYVFSEAIAELSGKYPDVKFIALDMTEGKWTVSADVSLEPATTNVQVNWLGNIQ